MRFASEWPVGSSWLLADTCSLEGSSNPPAAVYSFLQGREVLSCCRRGEREEVLSVNKMLTLSACVPAKFRCESVSDAAVLSSMYKRFQQ